MKHLFLVMTIGVLVGCGKKDSVKPNTPNPKASQPTTPNSYTANTNTTKPEPAKSKVIVGVKLWEFETGDNVWSPAVWSSPAIGSDSTVYVGSRDKKLYAINGKTGVKLWEFKTGSWVTSSPAIGSDGTVYVGSEDKKLYAVNGKTGVKLWEFETRNRVLSSPAMGSDGTVYVGSEDNKLYAIKTESKGPAKSPWPMFGQNAQRIGRVMK